MKLTQFALPIFCMFMFANCDEEISVTEIEKEQEEVEMETSKEVTYFTYSPNEYRDTSESDNWLIIHNQNGDLLGYQAFEREDTLVFSANDSLLTETNTLVITTLSARQNETSNIHNLETFTHIPLGLNWSFGTFQSDSESKNPFNFSFDENHKDHSPKNSLKNNPIQLIVNNIPGISKYSITSVTTGVVTSNFNPIAENTLSIENIELIPEINYILFVEDSQGGLKYIFLKIEENTNELVLDYSDFKVFEIILETQLPPNNYLFSVSRGFESSSDLSRGLEMSVELDFNSPQLSRIGYISGFGNYSTVFNIRMDSGYSYEYYERGLMPLKEISILEKPAFSVVNNSPHNFNFSTNIDFLRTNSVWQFEENLTDGKYLYSNWRINTINTTSHVVGNIPQEILDAYPELSLNQVKYLNTSLEIQGRTHEMFLENIINPSTSNQPKIFETIVLNAPEE